MKTIAIILICIAILLGVILASLVDSIEDSNEIKIIESYPVRYSPTIASDYIFEAHPGDVFWIVSHFTDHQGTIWVLIGNRYQAYGWLPESIVMRKP